MLERVALWEHCLDAVYQLWMVWVQTLADPPGCYWLKHKEHSTAVSQRAGVTDSAPSQHWGLLIQGPFPCYTHRHTLTKHHYSLCTQRGAQDVPSTSVGAMGR